MRCQDPEEIATRHSRQAGGDVLTLRVMLELLKVWNVPHAGVHVYKPIASAFRAITAAACLIERRRTVRRTLEVFNMQSEEDTY